MQNGFAVGDRVVIRPDFVLAMDGLERDAIGVVEAVQATSDPSIHLVDVRFAPDRLDQGLRSDTLERVPERNVTVGHSNHGLD